LPITTAIRQNIENYLTSYNRRKENKKQIENIFSTNFY